VDPSVEGGRVLLGGGPSYTLTINDTDYSVYYEIECPDPSTPTGYGEPIQSSPTSPITTFDPQLYDFFRYKDSDGGTSEWYSTATSYGGFWGNGISSVPPPGGTTYYQTFYNARIVWGAGGQVCISTTSISGVLGSIVVKALGSPITETGAVTNFNVVGSSATVQEFCSSKGAGVWEFALAANPTQMVRTWNGTNMGDPEANWPA
jgi:hypothetical protein